MAQTILVIDDSKTIQHQIVHYLQEAGFETLVADDPYDAIKLLVQHQPDLILCDIVMPGMDGYEMLAFVRNNVRLAETPMIIVSSCDADWDQEKADLLGADGYLIKPVSRDDLIAKVSHHLSAAATR
jgi:twitching motility two-component system response regulator PilG